MSKRTSKPVTASTSLVPTHCAICGRKLTDAVSVARGIGPECNEVFNTASRQAPSDWSRVAVLLADERLSAAGEAAAQSMNALGLADVLVQLVAIEQRSERAAKFVATLRALGYTTLAARIEFRTGVYLTRAEQDAKLAAKLNLSARLAPAAPAAPAPPAEPDVVISVNDLGQLVLFVALKHVSTLVPALRGVPGRRYDSAAKVNVFPATSKRALWGALAAGLPAGTPVKGPKGVFAV
jgi:hypothetical protein